MVKLVKGFSRPLPKGPGAPRRMKPKLRMTAQMMLGILNLEPSIRKRPAVDEIAKNMGRWGATVRVSITDAGSGVVQTRAGLGEHHQIEGFDIDGY